ncbi:MAG TPA: hypothetical protein VGA86_01145, partial [Desulfatiglandales bacterium]
RKGTWVYYTPLKKDSAFNRQLFKLLREQLAGAEFLRDADKLRQRLRLREGDVCVVGSANKPKSKCVRTTGHKI